MEAVSEIPYDESGRYALKIAGRRYSCIPGRRPCVKIILVAFSEKERDIWINKLRLRIASWQALLSLGKKLVADRSMNYCGVAELSDRINGSLNKKSLAWETTPCS